MKIYFDMDGVLADFVTGYLSALGSHLKASDIRDWEIWRYTGQNENEMFTFLESRGPSFWYNLSVYPTAWPMLRVARNSGHEVSLLTMAYSKRNPSARPGKLTWASRVAPGVPCIVLDGDAGDSKASYANPLSLLIDDNPAYVRAFRSAGGHALLYRQPWNATETLPEFDMYAFEDYLRAH